MTPRDFAILAQEAYDAAPDIGKAGSASRAIVRQTAAGLCVAFPGTDNLDCITTDLNAIPIDVPGIGRMHRGFWQAWQAIAAQVVAEVGVQPVTLVGHSLGAAIATCAAVALTIVGRPPLAVWCFESPRVSPDMTVRALLARVPVRLYRNGKDLIPDVPLGWNHASLLTNVGKPAFPFPNIADHSLSRVIAALSMVPA